MSVYKAPDNKKKNIPNRYTGTKPEKTKKEIRKNENNNEISSSTPSKKGHNILIALLIIILIIAAAGLATFLIMRGQQATQNTNPTETAPATGATQQSIGHTIEQQDMPMLKEDDGSDGYANGAVYIWNKKGFLFFNGNVKSGVSYAKSISNYKTFLGNDIKVYDMVIPNNTEFGLPERISKDISNRQRDNTEAIITNLSSDVIPTDIYNILGQHRNDYIFYNTDSHWTNQGAYYAYTAFAQTAGLTPVSQKDLKLNKIEHKFKGSYIESTKTEETQNGNPDLLANLDTVSYYDLPKNTTVTAMKSGSTAEETISFYNTDTNEESTPTDIFNTFECSYAVIKNSDIKDKSKIAVVKDSFGDALAPFLAQHYSEVHLIDITNFKRNLKTYCTNNSIKEVLYVNSIMSANAAAQTTKTDEMFD